MPNWSAVCKFNFPTPDTFLLRDDCGSAILSQMVCLHQFTLREPAGMISKLDDSRSLGILDQGCPTFLIHFSWKKKKYRARRKSGCIADPQSFELNILNICHQLFLNMPGSPLISSKRDALGGLSGTRHHKRKKNKPIKLRPAFCWNEPFSPPRFYY